METILEKIIAKKRKGLSNFALNDVPCPPEKRNKRSFLAVLEHTDRMGLIAEYKRASPSKGDIHLGKDPVKQAKAYVSAGADAVSVLTESRYFKGSYHDLALVSAAVDVPVLCKDFIIDRLQIDAAKKAGADIILLIAAALDDDKLKNLYEYAREKELEVLLEVHNEAEAERALKTGNRLIGINNRNLNTFDVDLSVTEKLAPLLKKEGCFVISESGIKTAVDAKRVRDAGADGMLVGEALMRHGNVREAIKAMKISL